MKSGQAWNLLLITQPSKLLIPSFSLLSPFPVHHALQLPETLNKVENWSAQSEIHEEDISRFPRRWARAIQGRVPGEFAHFFPFLFFFSFFFRQTTRLIAGNWPAPGCVTGKDAAQENRCPPFGFSGSGTGREGAPRHTRCRRVESFAYRDLFAIETLIKR